MKPLRKILKTVILAYPIAILLGSCSHSYYIPPTTNVPLLKEKNELRATITAGGGSDIATTDFQAAYSITNHFAVMSNFMRASGSDDNENSSGTGNCFEIGAGYFTPIESSGLFEVYSGIGWSSQEHQYNSGGTSDLSFRKIFFQPSIGLTFNFFDIALTSGFSTVNFFDVNYQLLPTDSNFESVSEIAEKNLSLLFEPAITFRIGWKYIKFQTQLGLSHNLSHPELRFEPLKISVGFTFAISERFNN
jgi:hypothetical protein